MERPPESELRRLYIDEKKSPEEIGKTYGVSGRSIRNWMDDCGIQRLGPTHLRTGKPAPWNAGVDHSKGIAAARLANIGRKPWNHGKGSRTFACEVCGLSVTDKPYRKSRTCSKKCKDQLSHIHRGEEHWNYKGDEVTGRLLQRQRLWAVSREWREAVLKLGGHKCLGCGRQDGRLVAHHIHTWNDHPELRFEVSNGAVLCAPCHQSFHRSCGHSHSNQELLGWWLTMRQSRLASTG